jgi:hypothetical protein
VKEKVVMLRAVLHRVQSVVQHGLKTISNALSRWTKPLAAAPVLSTVADLARSKPQLITENLLLRQHLIVLNRSVKRPHFTQAERGLFVLLASRFQNWKAALLLVKPETVLWWHRQEFQLLWQRQSRAMSHEPKLPLTTIRLITCSQLAVVDTYYARAV